MVEVFRTNISDPMHAQVALGQIHSRFSNYCANFDLEDCDKILRIECTNEHVEAAKVIDLIWSLGHEAEILPDIINLSIH